jgi:diguanylate cyclase (GGDEF)-like protein
MIETDMNASLSTTQPSFLARLWAQAWSLVLIELSREELAWLLSPNHHLSLLSARRITMIVSRVRLVAGAFALLTPMWIVIDIFAFEREVWLGMMIARLVATAAFLALLWLPRQMSSLVDAYEALAILLAIPTVFYIYAHAHMVGLHLHGIQQAFAIGYAFLPFVMLAGLSMFPLTLAESLAFAMPMLLAQAATSLMGMQVFDWPTAAASLWLLVLVTSVAAMAGVSQLGFIIVLVREAIRDTLTGCFSRRSGQEILELQFRLAVRQHTPLAVAFIDLDHFKSINDGYGHDAGDDALRTAAASLRREARNTDVLIRWGGEEFLLVMPGADAVGAHGLLQRMRAAGIGTRPDGRPLTASIGVADLSGENHESWEALVASADARMYLAKQSGRDRIVGVDSPRPDKPNA